MGLYLQSYNTYYPFGETNLYENNSTNTLIDDGLKLVDKLPDGIISDAIHLYDKLVAIVDSKIYVLGNFAVDRSVTVSASQSFSIEGHTKFFYSPYLLNSETSIESGWTALHVCSHLNETETGFYAINNGRLYYWGYKNIYNGFSTEENTLLNNVDFVSSLTQLGAGTEYESGWQDVQSTSNTKTRVGIRDGKLYAWGENSTSGLGLSSGVTSTPTQIGTNSDWVKVSGGFKHFLAINASGELYTWGDSNFGIEYSPQRVGTESDWIDCTAAYYTSMGIRGDGYLYAWGNSAYSAVSELTIDTGTPTAITSVSFPLLEVDAANDYISDSSASSIVTPKTIAYTAKTAANTRYYWGFLRKLGLLQSTYSSIPEYNRADDKISSIDNPSGILYPYDMSQADNIQWDKLKFSERFFVGITNTTTTAGVPSTPDPNPPAIPTGDYLIASMKYDSKTVSFIEEGSSVRSQSIEPLSKTPYALDIRAYSDYNTLAIETENISSQPSDVYAFCSWSSDGSKFILIDQAQPFVTLFDTNTFTESPIQPNILGLQNSYDKTTAILNSDGTKLAIYGIGILDGSPKEGGLVKTYNLNATSYDLETTIEDDPDNTMRTDLPLYFINNDSQLILPPINGVSVDNSGNIFRVFDITSNSFINNPDLQLPVGVNGETSAVYTLSRDTTRLFALGTNGSMLVYDTTTWLLINTFVVNNWRLAAENYSLQMSPDDQTIYIIDSDTLEKVSRNDIEALSAGDFEIIWQGAPDIYGKGYITPDGVYLITADVENKRLSFFNLRTYQMDKVYKSENYASLTLFGSHYLGLPIPSPFLPSSVSKSPEIPATSNVKITGGRMFGTSGHSIGGGYIETYENFGDLI